MNYASLEILGMDVPIGTNQYHDDGFVESIMEHSKELSKFYGYSNEYCDKILSRGNIIGAHYLVAGHHHIFYLKPFTNTETIRIRAHEETHVPDSVGKIGILEERLFEEQGVKINFLEIEEKEIKAELGALYALRSRNIPIWRASLFHDNRDWSVAKKIYKQSKVPRKMIFSWL